MIQVIPVINCHFGDTDCVTEKVKKAEGFSGWVHLDAADGVFTFNRTWANPKAWKKLGTKLNLEVHLMVEKPEAVVGDWLSAGAKRIIFHFESVREDKAHVVHRDTKKLIHEILVECAQHRAEVMVALNPETPVEELKPYFNAFSEYQILAVTPGFAGQKFLPTVLEKIKFLRREVPNATIEVDGGITLETGKQVKAAGATILVSASYILDAPDPVKAFGELINV